MSCLRERFEERYTPEPNSGCWLWTGAMTTEGYGQIRADGKQRKTLVAHRVSHELYNGPIPSGLFVLHKCDTPACVNPAHLSTGTQKENIHDCISKGRFVGREKQPKCGKGHDMTGENIYMIRRASGKLNRTCRACANARAIRSYQRRKSLNVVAGSH